MCRVQIASPLRVLNSDMFAMPSTTFELPPYVFGLAHFLADAPSPPPSPIRHFNKKTLHFLDIEAEQCEHSDRHGGPSA